MFILLPLARAGECVPLGVAERLQPGELARALEPFAAVDHDALAVDVRRAIRDEVRGQVGQLLVPADALQRDAVERDLAQLGARHQPLPRARRGEGAGRDGVQRDAVLRPLHGQRTRQRQHARLGRGRWHDVGGAGLGVGGDDVEHAAAAARRDPAFAQRQRAIEGAVQHDAQHAVHGAVRQALRRAGEVAGGVVHQHVDAVVVLPDRGDHGVNRLRVAHVAGDGEHLAAVCRRHLCRGLAQHLVAAAGDRQLRAELEEALAHRAAQSRAAAGDHDDLVLEQVRLKTCRPPFVETF